MKKKKKVALLGGSFDPVHEGHMAMARAALEQLCVDEVWLIPAAQAPLKERHLSDAIHRLNMLRLACQKDPRLKICDVDLKRSGISYTVDTLEILKDLYDDIDFTWILGADQARQFDRWKNPQRLLELADFAVIDRDGALEQGELKYPFQIVSMEPVDVSSTQIRNGARINYLDPAVLQYILDHELYLVWWIKPQMDSARFAHSNSVARLCRHLARAHRLDEHKAYLSGLFHDIAKDMDKDEQRKWVEASFPRALDEHHAIWHGYAGSEIISRIFGIWDPVIKNAIASHVKGTSYDPYAMIVFIADKLDPLRGYDSSGLYSACLQDLYNGFMLVKAENKAFLEKEKMKNGRTGNSSQSNQ